MLRWDILKSSGRIQVSSLTGDPLIGIASAIILYFMLFTNLWFVPVGTVVFYALSEYICRRK